MEWVDACKSMCKQAQPPPVAAAAVPCWGVNDPKAVLVKRLTGAMFELTGATAGEYCALSGERPVRTTGGTLEVALNEERQILLCGRALHNAAKTGRVRDRVQVLGRRNRLAFHVW